MFDGIPGSPLSMLFWAVLAIAVIFGGARLLVERGRKKNEEFRETHDEPVKKP